MIPTDPWSAPPSSALDRGLRLSLIAGELTRLLRAAAALQGDDPRLDYPALAEQTIAGLDPTRTRRAEQAVDQYVAAKLDAIGAAAVLARWEDHSREEDFADLARAIACEAGSRFGRGLLTIYASALRAPAPEPQCDACGRHAPCVTGPHLAGGSETYACCTCRYADGAPCDECAPLTETV